MTRLVSISAVLVSVLITIAATPSSADLWNEEDILAGDGSTFGRSVSVSGDHSILGAIGDSGVVDSTGAAYVFEKVGVTWTEADKLIASDGAAGDWFGYAVSISGTQAIVGAPYAGGNGAAYVFEKIGDTWTEVDILVASDGADGDFFGSAVSISAGNAIVGAWKSGGINGSAYIFEKVADTWTQVKKFTPSDAPVLQRLGYSVSIYGNQAVAGAYRDDDNGSGSGSAYIYEKVGGVWTEADKVIASDGDSQQLFGYSVGISGDQVIVSAYHDNDLGDYSGSAYIFEKVGDTWTETGKLTASDGAANDFFGCWVSISGDQVISGAYGDDDDGDYSGSAYIFEKVEGTWIEVAKLAASDAEAQDWFGYSVGISGDQAIVGTNDGSAYVFVQGASQTFGLVSPENGAFLSESPVFEWTAAGYDYFLLYMMLSIDGTYYPVPIGWMPQTSLDSTVGDLWSYVDVYTGGIWLVYGVNSATGAWEVTDPRWFLKVP